MCLLCDKTTKRDECCNKPIQEVVSVWSRTCCDIMLLPLDYVNRRHFRSMLERRLREHFGYTKEILIRHTPIAQIVAFIRAIRPLVVRQSALAYALDGVFSRVLTDVLMKYWCPVVHHATTKKL